MYMMVLSFSNDECMQNQNYLHNLYDVFDGTVF